MRLPPEIERMMLEMQLDRIEREREAVLADPVKHKLTMLFPEGSRLSYRFWTVKKASFPKVRYCYAVERNLAGYFLGWRETISRDGQGKRDQWSASKRRLTVREQARKRCRAHEGRIGKSS